MNIRTLPRRRPRLLALAYPPSTLALLLLCTSMGGCRKEPQDQTGEQAGGNSGERSGEQGQSTTAVSHLLSATLEVDTGVSRLVFRFDTPATELENVGAVLDKAPVVSSPEMSWTGHFSDRQTLVITPATALSPATRYEIRFEVKYDF